MSGPGNLGYVHSGTPTADVVDAVEGSSNNLEDANDALNTLMTVTVPKAQDQES